MSTIPSFGIVISSGFVSSILTSWDVESFAALFNDVAVWNDSDKSWLVELASVGDSFCTWSVSDSAAGVFVGDHLWYCNGHMCTRATAIYWNHIIHENIK